MPRFIVPRQTYSKRIRTSLAKTSIHHTYKQGTMKLHVPVAPYYDPVKA